MPRTPMNYKNTVIYKIVCDDVDITECYVGHTTNFNKRKCGHKSRCNNINGKSYNFNVYKFIRLHGGWDNWSMIEIEKHSCDNKNEAEKRERYFIETLKAKLNSKMPSMTRKETQDKYHEANRDIINEKHKEYCIKNSDKIKAYRERTKESKKITDKIYYELNKGAISLQCKLYREQNKDKIKASKDATRDAYNAKRRLKRAELKQLQLQLVN